MNPSDVACLILASGLNRRFTGGDKLLASYRGQPVAAHVAHTALSVGFAQVAAVCGTDQTARRALFRDLGITVASNPEPERGQGYSIASGLRQMNLIGVSGVMVLLADMPDVRQEDLQAMCMRLDIEDAVVTVHNATRQPPVLFRSSILPDLLTLDGDQGARTLLRCLNVAEIAVSAEAGVDVDTVEDLDALQSEEAR